MYKRQLRAQGYKAFYIAIGCQGGRLPGIPNDTAKGCASAVDLLKEVNANEKYDIKGDVVVIGGGNVAIDVARDSKRCARDDTKVNMYCLESRETMPASVEEIEEAESCLLYTSLFSSIPFFYNFREHIHHLACRQYQISAHYQYC